MQSTVSRHRERGVSLAEYGLLVSLFVVASLMAVSSITSTARTKLEAVGNDVGTGSVSFAADSQNAPVNSPPTNVPTTVTPTTAAPTTAPPTTAAPTTTIRVTTTVAPTTAPPTTAAPTTAAPTTTPTTAAPASTVGGSAGASTRQWWDASTRKGAWVSTANITNSGSKAAWVYIEIRTIYGDGRVVTDTDVVYVAAGASAPYSTYDNAQSKNSTTADDVVRVEVQPTGGITYNASWQPIALVVSGSSITSTAPAMP
jgi:Flp pilus assembly pilin Flp